MSTDHEQPPLDLAAIESRASTHLAGYAGPHLNSEGALLAEDMLALVAALKAEQQRVTYRNNIIEGLGHDLKALQADLTRVEADRDDWREMSNRVFQEKAVLHDRLQARIAELEGSLREIANGDMVPVVWRKRARAVLEK